MNTLSRNGHPTLIELPVLSDYTEEELLATGHSWPAVGRYLRIIERPGKSPSENLRIQRHQDWLRSALAIFHEKSDAETICRFWSIAAQNLIREAWRLAGGDALPVVILSLGKLGAEELNLSSDVDLIIVRDDGFEPPLKTVREFQSLLSAVTDFGFCLRVDFNLRPGGRAAALVPSATEFEYHYGYHGEMWERLAFVRMRPLVGPPSLANPLAEFSRKFAFRKHLDYTLLDDLKSLRARIRQEYWPRTPSEFNLKLGRGGIRDLELFVHSLQVIHGGRNKDVRTHNTSEALRKLAAAGILPANDAHFLHESYWYLRDLENRLQAFDDQQTYQTDLQKGHTALPDEFRTRLPKTTARIDAIVTSLLGSSEETSTTLPVQIESQKEWLAQSGFRSESIEGIWPELVSATALSQASQRDEIARQRFLRSFVERICDIGLDRDLALSLLLDFVRATRAKATFFTLLNREPRLIEDLAWLFSTSPYLGNMLALRPELIDSYVLRRQPEPSADLDTLCDELAERRLLAELISANRFLADRDLDQLTLNLSSTADEIALLLLSRLADEFGVSDLGIVAMGKWGGRELGLKSDLDFIFVKSGTIEAADQKVARRFLSRMMEPHKGGSIYSVDMRLRPSGNAGPMLVTADSLLEYIESRAEAWERQAYLRSRPLGTLSLATAETAAKTGMSDLDRFTLLDIRQKLLKPPLGPDLDLKLQPGGLVDIEFTTQISLLSLKQRPIEVSTTGMIRQLVGLDASWAKHGTALISSYVWLRTIEQLHQLTTSQSGSKLRPKSEGFARLARLYGFETQVLVGKIRDRFTETLELLRELDPLREGR